LWASKFNQARVDGEPHNSSGPAFTPSVVRHGDELTKRQKVFPAIGLHSFHIIGLLTGERHGVFTQCAFFWIWPWRGYPGWPDAGPWVVESS
jgi:hypothetical protein